MFVIYYIFTIYGDICRGRRGPVLPIFELDKFGLNRNFSGAPARQIDWQKDILVASNYICNHTAEGINISIKQFFFFFLGKYAFEIIIKNEKLI